MSRSPHELTAADVRELLGRPKVHPEHAAEENEVGVATGMYYTPAGGDIMFVEASMRQLYGTASPDSLDTGRSGWARCRSFSPASWAT